MLIRRAGCLLPMHAEVVNGVNLARARLGAAFISTLVKRGGEAPWFDSWLVWEGFAGGGRTDKGHELPAHHVLRELVIPGHIGDQVEQLVGGVGQMLRFAVAGHR